MAAPTARFLLAISAAAHVSTPNCMFLIATPYARMTDAERTDERAAQDVRAARARGVLDALAARGVTHLTVLLKQPPAIAVVVGAWTEGDMVEEINLSVAELGVVHVCELTARVLRTTAAVIIVSRLQPLLVFLHCVAAAQPVLAPTCFCLAYASALEMQRTGMDRGSVPGLDTHTGCIEEYVRVCTSLDEAAQLDNAEKLSLTIAACNYMTATGVRVNRSALAAASATASVAAVAAELPARWRVAAALAERGAAALDAAEGGTWHIVHGQFKLGHHDQARASHLLHTVPRDMRQHFLPPPGCRVVSVDLTAVDFYAAMLLTGGALDANNDQYTSLADVIFLPDDMRTAVAAHLRRPLVKDAALKVLYGGDAAARAAAKAHGLDDFGANRVVNLIRLRLKRGELERMAAFYTTHAASLDGAIVMRPPKSAAADAPSGAAQDAAWKRTVVNIVVAGASSIACRGALAALHDATVVGVSAARATALVVAAGALVAAAGAPSATTGAPVAAAFDETPGGARLAATLTWWLHDCFYLTARADRAAAVAAVARAIVIEAAEAAVDVQLAALPGRAHVHFDGLRTLLRGGMKARFPAKAAVSATFAPASGA